MGTENDESERAAWKRRTGSLSRRSFLAMATGLAGGAAISAVLGARRYFEDGAAPVAAQNIIEPPRSIVASAVEAASAQARTGGSLPIPPLLSPRLQGGVKVFDLQLQPGEAELIPGVTTATLGINGPHLGPTLRAQLGDSILLNVSNGIGELTTIHWHGMHVPAAMDGGPHQIIEDGSTWSPRFAIQQQAASLWYHPHMLGTTESQVGRGLVGMFLLDDDNPVQDLLPHIYGVDDLPLILQDVGADGRPNVGFRRRGQIATLANGALDASFVTDHPRVRLRLLNATSRRFYTLSLADDQVFHQVASDGGLLPTPVQLTRLTIGPAERAEIVVDLGGEESVVLQSQGFGGGPAPVLAMSSTASGSAGPLPAQLNPMERVPAAAADLTRDMVLTRSGGGFSINGQAMRSMDAMHDMSGALQVRMGDTELWNIMNRSGATHMFHIHDIEFQIVDRDGRPPPDNELGWKDTVMVRPNETARVIMRFADFADPNTPYMFHCHVLGHEDGGMMGQFVVVA
jgi:suppressor of ftsI